MGDDALCGGCMADPPAIDGMRAAVAYGEVAKSLALRLKYGRRPGIAQTFARQMQRLVTDTEDALLVPVPLHRWRIWSRGYNQSALIVRALAGLTGLPFAVDALERTRATPVLRGLSPRERKKTVKGAFRVNPGWREQLTGRQVILIDDVYTTGATANACARVLKQAGVQRVVVCSWARVVRDIDNAAAR